MLLDRHCRYPGCTVDALECDLDHVINHDEGGETSIANLACLCRFHHNIKTEQRIHYSLDANRIATFHFRNGATKTTQPGGIKVKHRFSQTWQRHEQQRIRTRRNQSA
nr:HNH endonuclease signature motif containing protein [Corynebacterium diphtheriae]